MKASVDAADALKAEPYKADSLHCPFKWRHGVPIFDFYGKYPPKADRFAKAMAAYRRSKIIRGPSLRARLDLFPLADIPV